MRIGNPSGPFSGRGSSGGDRARIFRNRHRVGERVKGRLLRWEQPGQAWPNLAWIDIQGQELLAQIHSQPEPGQILVFLVVQLYPDIVLQELHGGGPGSGSGAPLSLSGAVHAFWAARSLYESASRPERPVLGPAPGMPASERRSLLHSTLGTRPDVLARYLRLLGAVQLTNAFLGPMGAGRLCYPAWLLPAEALAAEMLMHPGRGAGDADEAVLAFALPRAGQCLVRLVVRPGVKGVSGGVSGSCRVSMERPSLGRAMDAALDVLLARAGLDGLSRLETAALPPEHRAGLLAGLLHAGGGGAPGFATRV